MEPIQNFAQLKALFKDIWETIPGNSDVCSSDLMLLPAHWKKELRSF